MKKRLLISLISLTVLFALPLAAAAGVNPVLPGGGWWTGSRIQNVGLTTVDVDMTAYDSASASTYTATKSATAGGAVTFLPADFAGMPDGFIGSGIVSAAEPIRAVVNVTNRLSGGLVSARLAAAQYQEASIPRFNFDVKAFYRQDDYLLCVGMRAAGGDHTARSCSRDHHYTASFPGRWLVPAAEARCGHEPPLWSVGPGFPRGHIHD
jgi:hypothetical protein